jgi:hypothetical protein
VKNNSLCLALTDSDTVSLPPFLELVLLIGRQSFECNYFPINFLGELEMGSLAILQMVVHG